MLEVLKKVEESIKPVLLKKAEEIGLNLINSNERYCLKKLGAKNESQYGYPNSFTVISGTPYLVGVVESEKPLVWLAVFGRGFENFKTSPIISCQKQGVNFEIETENSFYRLEKL